MPRYLSLLSAISIVLVAIIGIQSLLPDYGLVNVGLYLTGGMPQAPNTQPNESYVDDFQCNDSEPMLEYGTDCYGSDMST